KSAKSNVDALLWSGMKIIHIPDLDYNTNYYTFKDALRAIKNWSDSNKTHVPIYIMVELKNQAVSDVIPIAGFKKAIPFDEKALLDVRDEIYSIFDTSEILKPDDVRGNYETLRQAVTQKGFPKLKDVRGKVVFILMMHANEGEIISQKYPSFRGLPYFAYSKSNSPEAAFINYDDPKKHFQEIKNDVDSGFIIRTRADAETREARDNDYSYFEAAKIAGAQIISTDFYLPFKKTGYVITKEMLRK
ncbi:MAG TPA: Ca2+-dependent phosphoinositide-specific phospholipase C, partial [Chitinophagales bacterium]